MKTKNSYVWVWTSSCTKVLFSGSQNKCREFKRGYTGYYQKDMYISFSE